MSPYPPGPRRARVLSVSGRGHGADSLVRSGSRHDRTAGRPFPRTRTSMNRIFGGRVRTEVRCGRRVRTRVEHLKIGRSDTVGGALDGYLEDEPYACRARGVARKQYSIERAPNVLCVQLKRYTVKGRTAAFAAVTRTERPCGWTSVWS